MSDYDTTLFFQTRQQRFEAALRFAILNDRIGTDYCRRFADAVKLADALLATLEETKE
jgi:hypothetical protein